MNEDTTLTMRCWADTRLSQSLSDGTLLKGCMSSGWAFPWSRLCRGSWGAPLSLVISSFSQDKCSWLMASSPSATQAKWDVACLEVMTLLWSNKRSEIVVKTNMLSYEDRQHGMNRNAVSLSMSWTAGSLIKMIVHGSIWEWCTWTDNAGLSAPPITCSGLWGLQQAMGSLIQCLMQMGACLDHGWNLKAVIQVVLKTCISC